jgi:cytochrome c oxidase subunit 2
VKFTIQSKDVLHDFWVPAFRMKLDAVPGIDVHYRVTPNRLGTFQVVCAELCGLGHAVMRQSAHVLKGDEFTKWLSDRRAGGPKNGGGGATTAGGGGAVDGKTLFTSIEPSCANCHTLADAGASGQVGPNLDEVLKGKDEAFIKSSIVEPDKEIAPGFTKGIMPPNYAETLDPQEIDALVSYLSKVTK